MNNTDPQFSIRNIKNRQAMQKGMRDGIPISLGYLAVSFSLGIVAKNVGLTPFQSFLVSLLCNASAGEYAGFTVIAAGASFLEMAIVTLIANARYLLMSAALSQRLNPKMPFFHRFLIAYDVTDELFGINIAQPGYINPFYTYGAVFTAAPGWAIGTALGTIAGNILPLRVVSALSVALYGMFLAVIIPPAKKDRVIAVAIVICFAASYLAAHLPFVSELSEGTRTILLTVIIASGAAILFPKTSDTEADQPSTDSNSATAEVITHE